MPDSFVSRFHQIERGAHVFLGRFDEETIFRVAQFTFSVNAQIGKFGHQRLNCDQSAVRPKSAGDNNVLDER